MTEETVGRALREPALVNQATACLGPTGFDPARRLTPEQAVALGFRNCAIREDGTVYSMENAAGYLIVVGSPSYLAACSRAVPTGMRPADPQEAE